MYATEKMFFVTKVPFPLDLTHPDVYEFSIGIYNAAMIPRSQVLDTRNMINPPIGLVTNATAALAGCILKGFLTSLVARKSMLGIASEVANQYLITSRIDTYARKI